VIKVDDLDHKALFSVYREATVEVIRKILYKEPTIDQKS